MPVILPPLQSLTTADFFLQCEKMRSAALQQPVSSALVPGVIREPVAASLLVPGEQSFPPMLSNYLGPQEDVMLDAIPPFVSANACICTAAGAIIDVPLGNHIMLPTLTSTELWKIEGVTREELGAVLPFCDVLVFEVGRLSIGEAPVVARTTSDASGNYSVFVPTNVSYWVAAYRVGSPDAGGVSLMTIKPTQV